MSDSNIPFQITATKQEGKAVIRIVGEIGWATNAEDFRSQVDELIAEGIEDVHVYINSPGGSCFDAAEIVNILSKFEGKVTGEGGALVASAATYIAVHCSEFTMPENGMFMIHKPSGGVYGTADEIESYLSLLKAIDGEYYGSYSKVAKDKTALDRHWGVSDYWMTAKKAKEQGFVSKVTPKINIGKDADAIQAMMYGERKGHNSNNVNKNKQMEVKVIAATLGLPADATEEQVGAKIAENARKAAELDALKARLEAERKSKQEASIKAILEKAIADKRITADTSAAWQKMLCDNFEEAKAAIEAIKPIKKLSSQIAVSQEGGKATYNGKTFAELQETNPEALEKLERTDPEAFAELFNSQYKKGGK